MQNVISEEQLERSSMYNDMYKDAHGIRPSSAAVHNFEAMSQTEQEAELQWLSNRIEVVIAEEKADQEEAIKHFEAAILEVMKTGAKDRATAIRWMAEADNMLDDPEHFCWHHNLPYDYIKSFD